MNWPSLSLPDALIDDSVLQEIHKAVTETATSAPASVPETKKGSSKYINILNFVRKCSPKPVDAPPVADESIKRPAIPIFDRPLAKTDLAYPLPTHPVYTATAEVNAFLGKILSSCKQRSTQEVSLDAFYRRCSDKQKTQPIDAIMQPHRVLRMTLLNNDVDLSTANKVRRVFFGFFETPETLRFFATYSPSTSVQQLQQFMHANAQGELIIPAESDAKFVHYYEERARYVRQRVKELQRYYNESKPNEDKGFTRGVASIFIPARTFFGHHCINTVYTQIGPCNPFGIEEAIDYDCETCGFDQSVESEESYSDANDDNDSELRGLNLPEDYNDDLDPKGVQMIDNDDLEPSEEAATVPGTTAARFLDKERALRAIAKHASRFIWPVPIHTPDTIVGAKPTYTISSRFWQGCVNNRGEPGDVTQVGYENMYGVVINTKDQFDDLHPIFLQSFSV